MTRCAHVILGCFDPFLLENPFLVIGLLDVRFVKGLEWVPTLNKCNSGGLIFQ